jgi:hypothetical protein
MTSFSSLIARYAEASQRLVNQAGEIVLRANEQINNGTFNSAQWAKSAYELSDLALTAGADMAPGLVSIPCLGLSSDQDRLSDFINVDPDNQCRRRPSVVVSFVHVGAPSYVIPDQLIVFEPETLPVYSKQFRVGSTSADVRCGTYRGSIRLTRIESGGALFHDMDVIVDL